MLSRLVKYGCFLFGAVLALHSVAVGDVVKDMNGKVIIDTQKVSHIYDVISPMSQVFFDAELAATAHLKGPRLIRINSPGGYVSVGLEMMELLRAEQKLGTKLICVVEENAHSMAFNILSMCDKRLSIPSSHMIFHKIAMSGFDPDARQTANYYKDLMKKLNKADEPFRRLNAKALHMSLKQYDKYADEQKSWSAALLLFRGYLHGIVTIDPPPASASNE